MKLEIVDPMMDQNLIEWVMTKGDSDKAAVFRYYSLWMYGMPLNCLQPKQELMKYLFESQEGDQDSKIFDQLYANQIMNDKGTFFDLMTFLESLERYDETIIVSNYTHPNVYPILDSLIKFIQQRYGIQTFIINDSYDIDPFSVSEFETEEGYQNYLRDIEWYLSVLQRG